MKKCILSATIVCLMFLLPETSYSFDPFKPLGDFVASLSDWDPVGKALNPIEEAIPGLYLRGFFRNRTNYNLHGKTHHEGVKGIPKMWDFHNIFWETEFEIRYKLNPRIEFVNIYNFQYDAVPDWVTSLPKDADYSTRHYRRKRDIIRELFLSFTYPKWSLRIGKQQEAWGKAEGSFGQYLNILNPGDLKEGPLAYSHEWMRIPTFMVNYYRYWSNSYLQLIWIPDFQQSIKPAPGATGFSPTSSLTQPSFFKYMPYRRPARTFENSEFATRMNSIIRGWDISLIYMYDWSDLPSQFLRRREFNPRGRPTLYLFEMLHTRQHNIGWAIDKNFDFLGRQWVFRNETIIKLNTYVGSSKESMVGDGLTKRDFIDTCIALEASWFRGEWTTVIQPGVTHYFGYAGHEEMWPGKKLYENTWVTVINIQKKFYDDLVKTSYTAYLLHNDGCHKHKATIAYTISGFLEAIIAYYNWSGSPTELWGRYDHYDNIGFELKYGF